jgi:hypothetical protein
VADVERGTAEEQEHGLAWPDGKGDTGKNPLTKLGMGQIVTTISIATTDAKGIFQKTN